MNVAILFDNKSETVVQVLEKTVDDINMKPFSSLNAFINYVKQSNKEFDRILLNTNVVVSEGIESLQTLYDFLRDYMPLASVVFIVAATDTTNVQVDFSRIFNLSIYTDATASKTSSQFVIECIKDKITDIRAKYSVIKDDDADEDMVMEDYSEEDTQEDVNTPDKDASTVVSSDYIEPIISSDSPTFNPKDKRQMQELRSISESNRSLSAIIAQFHEHNIKEGYLTNMHYDLNLGDVDPTTLVFKQRQKSGAKRTIHVIKQDLAVLKNDLNPLDRLRLAYAENKVINYQSFFEPAYVSSTLIQNVKGANRGTSTARASKNSKPKRKGLLSRIFGGR